MTDLKLTDEENILLLLKRSDDLYANTKLTPEEAKTLLTLINRQKASLQEVITLNSKLEAENAKIQRLLDFYEKTGGNKKAKAEAIKEFAWRLKNKLTPYPEAPFCEMVGSLDIDALVKEMTEENK